MVFRDLGFVAFGHTADDSPAAGLQVLISWTPTTLASTYSLIPLRSSSKASGHWAQTLNATSMCALVHMQISSGKPQQPQ